MKQNCSRYVMFMFLVFSLILCNGISVKAARTGWTRNGNSYRYQIKGSYVKNKIKKIKKKYYYFDKKGICKTGWQTYKGNKYYFDKKKRYAYTGLKKIKNNLYLFKNNGKLISKKGLYTYNNKIYYVGKKGKLRIGWQKIDNQWKYFNVSLGYMETGKCKIGEDTYIFDSEGNPGYGLHQENNNYYFCNQWGKILKNKLIKYQKKCYFSNSKGYLVKGLCTVSRHKYYFGNDYAMVTGFVNLDKNILYFATNGQLVVNDWITVGGKKYCADRHGYLKRNCWYKDEFFNYKGEVVTDAVRFSDKERGFITSDELDTLDISKCNKLMIVAHPDDETLWGGAHLAEGGYFVVCLTNGDNTTRKEEFESVIELSGNRGMILSYPDSVNGQRSTWKTEKTKIAKDIDTLLKYKKWDMVVTHNPKGEYGHMHHKYTNALVTQVYYLNYSDDKLYYFGKHYNAKTLPLVSDKLKRVSEKNLKEKYKYLNEYKSQAVCVSQHIHLAPYENWCQSSDWK